MPPDDPTALSPRPLAELLFGGDWASAHSHGETLAAIARQVARRVRPAERLALEEVARQCEIDMTAATASWIAATAPVRHRCSRPGPRHDDVTLVR
jgi:hypothetical protein